MSSTVTGSGSSPVEAPMTIVGKLEMWGHESLDAVEHAAVRLVGWCATTEQSLMTLAADHPILQTMWDEGVKSAEAHGVPVVEIEDVGSAILAAAKQFAAGLSQPAPAPQT